MLTIKNIENFFIEIPIPDLHDRHIIEIRYDPSNIKTDHYEFTVDEFMRDGTDNTLIRLGRIELKREPLLFGNQYEFDYIQRGGSNGSHQLIGKDEMKSPTDFTEYLKKLIKNNKIPFGKECW